ncbi:hypothetical protein LJC26_05825 [Desulfovibrio sp. OttesenSCG-928-O18]|nr:hypothetical protein [Desulfovibrio sp. OttesenSCG-928-O18]
MLMVALVLLAMLAVMIPILLAGTRVKIDNSGIKMGVRTYINEDIECHQFSVNVRHTSPAEYASELNVHIPWTSTPFSHRARWIVELDVFDVSGLYLRRHLLQRPSERAAEKLAAELRHALASRSKLLERTH